MSKYANEASISELIYYIYVYNPNFERKALITQLIDSKFKNIYHFNDDEIKFVKQIEIQKLKERTDNNYLFNETLSISEKVNIIYDLYEKNKMSNLTISELAIATNIMIVILDYYHISKKRAKNSFQIQKSLFNYKYATNITNELVECYNTAIDGDSNYRRFRSMYVKSCLPNEKEKSDIKELIKKQSKN